MRKDQQPSSRVEFEVKLPPTSTGEPGALLRGKGHLIRREDLGNQVSGVAAAIERYEFITTSVSGNPQKLEKSGADGKHQPKRSITGPVLVKS
jgi:hypothetical protein